MLQWAALQLALSSCCGTCRPRPTDSVPFSANHICWSCLALSSSLPVVSCWPLDPFPFCNYVQDCLSVGQVPESVHKPTLRTTVLNRTSNPDPFTTSFPEMNCIPGVIPTSGLANPAPTGLLSGSLACAPDLFLPPSNADWTLLGWAMQNSHPGQDKIL